LTYASAALSRKSGVTENKVSREDLFKEDDQTIV